MNLWPRLLGKIYPPYKYRREKEKGQLLFVSLMNSLPSEFDDLKKQSQHLRFGSLEPWVLYPGFHFLSLIFPGETHRQLKKKGQNYRIEGISIYNLKKGGYSPLELLIKNNTPIGLKIGDGGFNLTDLDVKRIKTEKVRSIPFDFAPDVADTLWDQLPPEIRQELVREDCQEIEMSGRTFFTILDLEDGNYIAINKRQEVFSLVHKAKPASTKMKISLAELMEQISNGNFSREQHLAERYAS